MPHSFASDDGRRLNVSDRGRETDWFRPPSLRTGLADFPHPALQLMVLPQRGLNELRSGIPQIEQPEFSEEMIWPFLMVNTTASTAFT